MMQSHRTSTRRARACVSFAVVALLGLAPAIGRAQPTPASTLAPRVVTLDNGFQIVVAENHSVPLATATLVVRTGAMTQGADEQGVPHLFEHMLFKGYRGIDDRPFGSETSSMQASYNGTTSDELVTYYLTLPSVSVEDGTHLLASLVRDAAFRAEDLRTERYVVLGEMQRRNSDPQDLLRREIEQRLWGAGWPRKNAIGDEKSLVAVVPDRLDAIYRRYYVPNNAALVVTGDVVPDRVIDAARRNFGGWKQRSDPFVAAPVPEPPALAQSVGVVVGGDVTSVTVRVQWQGPSVRRDVGATYDADVLSDVLNDPESSFHRRLVDDGPFQSATMSYETLVHDGPITFVGTTTAEQLPNALSMLLGELTAMRGDDYFDPRALATAAKRRRVAQSFEREEGVSLAHALAYAWAVTGLPYHASYADSLATRRPADLMRFVTRYVAGRPFVVGVLAPKAQRNASAVMLDQFIEMSQPLTEKKP